MITRLRVTNWQSLRDLDVRLGRFTVIVGPSNVGKSALVRALRALASNVRGTSAISRGATELRISAETCAGVKITLRRDEGGASYTVRTPEGCEQSFTKLAGGVPDAVTRALGLQPSTAASSSINFAGQFDRPYLIDASGADVARELGALSNVHTLLQAAREANRRRAAAQQSLKTREEDLAGVLRDARVFAAVLPEQLRHADTAEAALARAQRHAERIARLDSATGSLQVAQGVLSRATPAPQVPDLRTVHALHGRTRALDTLIGTWRRQEAAREAAGAVREHWGTQIEQEQATLRAALLAAGRCPTCQQSVTI